MDARALVEETPLPVHLVIGSEHALNIPVLIGTRKRWRGTGRGVGDQQRTLHLIYLALQTAWDVRRDVKYGETCPSHVQEGTLNPRTRGRGHCSG